MSISTRVSRGVTLIELVVFIVIVGIAMAGLFSAFNTITAASADPQVRKQVLAIAESLMEEVALMPFTYCDPNDANAATAGSSAGCAVASNSEDAAMGPELGETRYNTSNPFNNVSDYHNAPIGPGVPGSLGILDIGGNPITGLGAYSASIAVSQAGLASGVDAIPVADALKITVTVKGPNTGTNQVTITLESYRARYQPKTLP